MSERAPTILLEPKAFRALNLSRELSVQRMGSAIHVFGWGMAGMCVLLVGGFSIPALFIAAPCMVHAARPLRRKLLAQYRLPEHMF